jgi:hypothetical protein
MVIIVREKIHGIIIVVIPLTKGAEPSLLSIQNHLFVLQVMVSVNVHEDSRVVDRDECHLYKV